MSNRRRYPTAPVQSTYGYNVQPSFQVQYYAFYLVYYVPMLDVEDYNASLPPIATTAGQLAPNVVAGAETFYSSAQADVLQYPAAKTYNQATLSYNLTEYLREEVTEYYNEKLAAPKSDAQITQSDIIQLTHDIIPYSQYELYKFKLPVGFVFYPLLNVDLPTVNFNYQYRTNPPRCSNCKAYPNCYSSFSSTGRLVCNFCGAETVFDFEYERVIKQPEQRALLPEYANEAYYIEAPDIYRARKAESFETFALIIDVSQTFCELGALEFVSRLILDKLTYLKTLKMRTMLSITLINSSIHYVVFKQKSFELYTVSDVDETFIPAPRDIIVSLFSRWALIAQFLQQLPRIAVELPQNPPCSAKTQAKKPTDIALLAAINGVYNCMSGVGGKICYFVGAGNTCGMGYQTRKVKKEDIKLSFQGLTEFVDLGTKCGIAYVSVDGYLLTQTAQQENDVASLVELSRLSSGYLRYLPAFSVRKHKDIVSQYLDATFDTFSSLESCTRLRITNPVECKYFYGKGQNGYLNLLNLAHVDYDETFACEINIPELLKMNQRICVQLSFLFTDKYNRRFIRVITKTFKVGTTINFYNSVNPEVALAVLAKKVAICLRPQTYIESDGSYYCSADANKTKHKGYLSSNTDYLTLLDGLMGQILTCFSHFFYLTNFTAVDQLPYRYQKFLTYLFALTKVPFCRPFGSRYNIDQRASYLGFIEGATVLQIVNFIYPLVYYLGGSRVRLFSENLQQGGIFIGCIYDQVVVFFHESMIVEQIAQFCDGTVDLNDYLQLGDTTDEQLRLYESILNVQYDIGFDFPIVAVSGAGKHKYQFLTGMIESRMDGLGWFDFLKLLMANLRKE